jgi:hypothetical protein
VFLSNGEISRNQVLVSYKQCQPGEFEVDIFCYDCPSG